MLLRRHRLTRVAVLVIYAGISVLGIAVAGLSLARSADAITYAVERTRSLG